MEIICGVPQGSILGPILFNIFINDIFYFIENARLCNYADDNTLYTSHKEFGIVENILKNNFQAITLWFEENFLILNPEKCSFIVLGNKKQDILNLEFENFTLSNVLEEKILGITIDHQLKFDSHIKCICKKANQKLSALSRISCYMNEKQRKLIINSFVKSQFNYCPLIWMFCSRKANNRIDNIQKRSLRLLSNDYESSFEELLSLNKEITTHQRCLQLLCTETFKVINNLATEIITEIFPIRHTQHNLRINNVFLCRNPRTKGYGLNSICYRANQIWNTVPDEFKNSKSLSLFKTKIKSLKADKCLCSICLIYIANIGYT